MRPTIRTLEDNVLWRELEVVLVHEVLAEAVDAVPVQDEEAVVGRDGAARRDESTVAEYPIVGISLMPA